MARREGPSDGKGGCKGTHEATQEERVRMRVDTAKKDMRAMSAKDASS